MNQPRRISLVSLLLLGIAFSFSSVEGRQDTTRAVPPPPLPGDTIELVFEREVFSYPSYERRNPFRPLTGEDSAGPRFEDLVLMGRILSSNPASSIALVGANAPGATNALTPARTFRLRVGDVLGNTRILEIREQLVLVEVEEFGLRETRVLEMQRGVPPAEASPATPEAAPAPPPPPTQDTIPATTAPDAAAADSLMNGYGGWA